MAKFFGIGQVIHNLPNKSTYESSVVAEVPVIKTVISTVEEAKAVVENLISAKNPVDTVLEVSEIVKDLKLEASVEVTATASVTTVSDSDSSSTSASTVSEVSTSNSEASTIELDPLSVDFSLSKKQDTTTKRNKRR